jgi:hypothetical protein
VRLLSKLLLLVVVLLMPLAMAPLAAGSSPHHEMGADVPMGHCPDQGSGPHGKSGLTECTMACAAALPAANTHFGRVLVICEPVTGRDAPARRPSPGHGYSPSEALLKIEFQTFDFLGET